MIFQQIKQIVIPRVIPRFCVILHSSWPTAAILNFRRHIEFWSLNQKNPYQKLILIYLPTSVQILLLLSKNARLL